VSAVASDGEATVTVHDVDPATGRIAVDVAAADGTTTQTYAVDVARRAAFLAAPQLRLSGDEVTVAAAVDPQDATLEVAWSRDGVRQPQTGTTYSLGAADSGTTLTATVTATRDGFVAAEPVSVSLAVPADTTGPGPNPGAGPGSGSGSGSGGPGTDGAGSASDAGSASGATANGRLAATGVPSPTPILGLAALLLAAGACLLVAVGVRRRSASITSSSD
jgi:hypothetical protein